MLTLYHFSDAWGLDPSPFCAKVQIYLRLAGIPYRSVPSILNCLKAPRGKLPYIDDEGTIVPDSHAIIAHLKRRYGDPLDAGLSREQIAEAHLVTRMVEEGLYWIGVYSRWVEPAGWEEYRSVLFAALPGPVRAVIAGGVRRDYRRRLRALGLMQRPPEEVYRLGLRDLEAIAAILGDKAFLLGPEPTTLDATVYGSLGNAFYAPLDSPLKDALVADSILAPYLAQMRDRTGLPQQVA